MTRKKNWRLYILSFVTVILFFQVDFGLKILLPTNVSWLMTVKTDWNTHYLGWFFYRNEPFHFPLGKITNYFYPIGTNVGFTDSIPLLAMFFKLFSPLLPADFQYFGIWLLICHLLIAYFTIRICELFSMRPILIFLAVIFMTQNPVLLYRAMHPALCAHWLFLASTYLYLLDPTRVPPAKIFRYQLILLLLSALITPYLLVIEFGFTVIIAWKHLVYDKSVDWKFAGRYLGIGIVGSALLWLITGMISFDNRDQLAVSGGFGKLSMNLNAFYDPSIWSSILPEQKRTSILQYEGFMYLGVGIFFLLLIALVYQLTKLNRKAAVLPEKNAAGPAPRVVILPLVVLSALLAFAAITNTVSFNDKVLFVIPVPAIVTNTGDIFRASGRFFWPVYYLLLFWLIIGFSRSRWPGGLKAGILGLALIIQLYDIKFLLTYQRPSFGAYQPPISRQWDTILRHFDKVYMYPPMETDFQSREDYQYFAFLAAKQSKPIDVGYVARYAVGELNRFRDSMQVRLLEGRIDPRALYITTPPHLDRFGLALQTNILALNSLDGYCYLYDKQLSDKDLLPAGDSAAARSKKLRDSVLLAMNGSKVEFHSVDSVGSSSDTVRFATGSLIIVKNYAYLNGWCFLDGKKNNKGDSLFAYLQSPARSYVAPMTIYPRPDVTAAFKGDNLDDAGFDGSIFENRVDTGTYKLGIAIKEKTGKWFYKLTDREVRVERTDR